jgi:hypothetical protein
MVLEPTQPSRDSLLSKHLLLLLSAAAAAAAAAATPL